jgi:NAD(P)-dependent dehydrogenase (short-subunit alcohol dehydrogenase family)
MYINLSGFSAFVTGGSRGIGAAIVRALVESGATVAFQYNKNANEAQKLADSLGRGTKAIRGDFSQPDGPEKVFSKALEYLGGLDIVVNNAGIAIESPLSKKTADWMTDWNLSMQVNLNATAEICKLAIDYFSAKSIEGRIINIASRAAYRGDTAEYMAYAASKGGMVALTKSIARGLGKQGIKAFTVSPGFTKTDMADAFIKKYGEEHATNDLALSDMTFPEDIAPFVVFLSGGMADHATGQTFHINAGSYVI